MKKILFSYEKRFWSISSKSCRMVEGFVGPCMLGAMGIIFVAFLAPSGNCSMPYAPACGALVLPGRIWCARSTLKLHCSRSTAGAVVAGAAAGNSSSRLAQYGAGTFVIANYQNEQSDKERSGQFGAGKRD
jgi:hypothetical protein